MPDGRARSRRDVRTNPHRAGFSNDEERDAGLADKAPWLLKDRLVALGAKYDKTPEPWASYVTVDGNLYTGQNPSSSHELAQCLVKDLA
ncbi:hypothetical protein CFOUR_08065 [Corynebacterium fournieri]|nr:hypothetical protein CFOUR_08065 [Corynebacterium fournieri]